MVITVGNTYVRTWWVLDWFIRLMLLCGANINVDSTQMLAGELGATKDDFGRIVNGYAEVLADDLELNKKRLCEQWDPNTPFSTLIKNIKDATNLADHAGVPYTPEQTVSAAYTLV